MRSVIYTGGTQTDINILDEELYNH